MSHGLKIDSHKPNVVWLSLSSESVVVFSAVKPNSLLVAVGILTFLPTSLLAGETR